MFTLVFDIFIMCFVLSLEEEEGYSRSLFPSTVAAAAAGVAVAVVVAVAWLAAAGVVVVEAGRKRFLWVLL